MVTLVGLGLFLSVSRTVLMVSGAMFFGMMGGRLRDIAGKNDGGPKILVYRTYGPRLSVFCANKRVSDSIFPTLL